MQSFLYSGDGGHIQVLWDDGVVVFGREVGPTAAGDSAVFVVRPVAEHPAPTVLARFIREYSLRGELNDAWALSPIELRPVRGSIELRYEDQGGELLARLVNEPMGMGRFLPLAVNIVQSLRGVHQAGFIHKDIKPANIIVDSPDGQVRLTGFGIATRLVREKRAPESPETIDGTLAYMAPEQTGGTNRSIDTRSDLYSLGVTFYQMVTGSLPFTASDPMEWVHCHIARKPASPRERVGHVPYVVSEIIMALLAKAPEDRYQTVPGLQHDLQLCLSAWQASAQLDDFPLRTRDIPDRLLIPEKLYGREQESAAILGCLDRVVQTGSPELLLVVGPTGIGKSAAVHELYKAMAFSRALFTSGKFDRYQRDIPYVTLVQALRQLVRPLLSKNDAELANWRAVFMDALGTNARLMTDIIPELKLIVGDQPPVAELALPQAKVRFHSLFQRLIGVFARAEHPLVLFLDDLQWLDAATLDLLEDMLTRSELQHFLLIGAYRDSEVASSHPLARRLNAIKSAGGQLTQITLGPLSRATLMEMISDALRCSASETAELAELVQEKTGGNPFFVLQFLSVLADNGLLAFDHEQARWSWDIARIQAQGYTDNVVNFMLEKLTRLPNASRAALKELACLGNTADMSTLSLILGVSNARVDEMLWPARRLEIVERTQSGYRFTHDRIQEAAYSLLPERAKIEAHLRIGKLLLRHTNPARLAQSIFDIVNQLNRSVKLINSERDRRELAELNLMAGERAKASAAYASALNYFSVGEALLTTHLWQAKKELAFSLSLQLAECEFVMGSLRQSSNRLAALHQRANALTELSAVTCLRGEIYVTQGQHAHAVSVALDYLRHTGTHWSVHPTSEAVQQEYQQLIRRLGRLPIESLRDLPPITDPKAGATMEVLLRLAPAALASDANLLCLTVCRMANLSLEYGNSDGSSAAYVWLGVVLGPYLGDHRSGFRFASLGLELVERHGFERFRVHTYLLFGAHVSPWTRHIRSGGPMLRRVFNEANEVGDVTFAGYSGCNMTTMLLAAGESLDAVEHEAECGLAYARDHQYRFVVDLMTPQLQLVRTLRGSLAVLGHFDAEDFSEEEFEQRIQSHSIAGCWYWIRKLQARFFAGAHTDALAAAAKANSLLWTSISTFEVAEYHFYAALVRAALYERCAEAERAEHFEALSEHDCQLQEWAQHCPENFENRAALVRAEIARIEERHLDAMHLYEQSIRAAEKHGFIHLQALANELAAFFYERRGFETIARTYFREARHNYLRWGAAGKVRQLEELTPYTRDDHRSSDPTSTAMSPVQRLDLATVIKVSQAISGEMVHDRLIDTLMRTALEHAGGEKATLLLIDDAGYRAEACAVTDANGIVVQSAQCGDIDAAVPESVLRYVMRVRESVILDDALVVNTFSDDPYFAQCAVRSLLCLPLINRSRLIGLLHIENNLAPRIFTSERLAVLKLIALQAAISLENTRLYRDIEERESRIQRLVESDVICIVIWDLDGRLIDANDAFLNMLQYDRADLEAGLRWFDMTPPDWQDVHIETEIEELQTTGAMRAREKEFFKKDGTRVPVLIGAAVFDSQPNRGVAYILDLTDLKRAEAEVRKHEQRYREVQMELAHENRRSTMGQLTGSIAHEVNQPITATVINAQAALRALQSPIPDLPEIEDALKSIVKDGSRAGDIIARIRSLIQKSPAREDMLAINEPIREVIELIRSEVEKNAISVRIDLADNLPAVLGDRVQIQQVVLNLLVNAVEAMSGSENAVRDLFISTAATDKGEVLVMVRDSGTGMTPSIQDSAFDAFFTTKASGMGMGLSICRSIIEAHGGRIWASSNESRGAVLQFSLPVG